MILLVGAAGLGCQRRDAVVPAGALPTVVAGPRVALPDGGVHHVERLAWVAWRSDGSLGVCDRRTDDLLQPGRLARCVVVSAPGAAPVPRDWTMDRAFVRDASAPDFAPGRCRVLSDDVPGDPGAPAARASLLAPRDPAGVQPAPQLLDAWRPPPTVDGDYFSVEISFAPRGDRVAVLHVAVGLGEGERSVEVVAVELRPAPACR